jgi:Tfp pilus assembly major pilin PilA
LRTRLGLKGWRAVHWTAYACWPLAVVHGVATGTDARVGWFELLTAACVASVIAAIAVRLNSSRARRPAHSLAGGALLTALAAAAILFALQGPLSDGWAARAGTPAKLLASVRAPTRASVRAPTKTARAPAATLGLPLAGRLEGTIRRAAQPDGSGRVEIRAAVRSGSQPAVVAIDLVGRPLESGGLRVTGGTASLGSRAAPTLYTGR